MFNHLVQQSQDPRLSADQNILLGLCYRQLYGAATRLVVKLAEQLPLAIEVVCLAFCAGIPTAMVGKELKL